MQESSESGAVRLECMVYEDNTTEWDISSFPSVDSLSFLSMVGLCEVLITDETIEEREFSCAEVPITDSDNGVSEFSTHLLISAGDVGKISSEE